MNRRDFLVRTPAMGGAILATHGLTPAAGSLLQGERISIAPPADGHVFRPLERVTITVEGEGDLTVLDGEGRPYHQRSAQGEVQLEVAGALGHHVVLLERRGRREDLAAFPVAAATELRDGSGFFSELLDVLRWTMVANGAVETVRIDGRFYSYFVRWLRDHVHTLKGMKYFHADLKSAIELYADFQREDGMIWDNVYERNKEKNWWDKRFRYADFIRDVDEGRFELKRIPVENDVEYLFIEGLYHTWKATGDDAWMVDRLDSALRAVTYSLTDPYRWSSKHELLKRGFTIDTWDYQAEEDAKIADGDIMVVYLGRTRFGIMFGDNTGFAASCGYLAEMLEVADRTREAQQMRSLGEQIKQRIDALAWNGRHYVHHVPEDPNVSRDLGVDQSTQISLSNAYSLNRTVTHEQAVSIIRSYQGIREAMPEGAPGEWFAIYPPFPQGFDGPSPPWEYMNGGVTPIVAGELAHGAFEHGFEAYGVDILRRVRALAAGTDDYLHCAYRGKPPAVPDRTFRILDLTPYANLDFPGRGATADGKWLGDAGGASEPGIRTFEGIPFEILELSGNPGGTALSLSDIDGRIGRIALPVGETAASVYFLHTYQGYLAGSVTLVYEDGTTHTEYVDNTKFGNWWHTPAPTRPAVCRKAWRSDNDAYVALYVFGMDNPHPEKRVRAIGLEATKDPIHFWQIVGITLCDKPVFFAPGPVSYGIPDNWGAAAVVYALIEGLVGVKDTGVAFDRALLSPRWAAAGEEEVEATVRYEASGGYVSYRYRAEEGGRRLTVTFTGRPESVRLEVLLPAGFSVATFRVDDVDVQPELKAVEQSTYAGCTVSGVGVHRVVLESA